MVPGRALHRLAKFVLPAHVCDQIVDAQLADFQHEAAEARSASAWVLVLARGYAGFGMMFLSCAFGTRHIAVEDRRAARWVFAITTVLSVVATLCLAMLFTFPMQEQFRLPWRAEMRPFLLVMFLNMASQFVPLAASIGLVCGIAMGLTSLASRESTRLVLAGIAISCLVMFVLTSWMLPLGFRAASRAIRGQPSLGQPAAATIGDDQRRMIAEEHTPTAGPGMIRGVELNYYFRWSYPLAILPLGLLALSLKSHGTAARMLLGLTGCAAYFYVETRMWDLAWTSHLPPMLVAWLPNLIFIALTLVVMAVRLKADTTEVGA